MLPQFTHRMMTVLILVGTQQLAFGDPPTTWQMTYGIHETPNNPQSPMTFIIRLDLERVALDGTAIGWEVASIRVEQLDPNGSVLDAWTEQNPTVGTTDGYWWTQHANPETPQVSEFAQPPALSGTASAQTPQNASLQYDLEGLVYTPPQPPETAPYSVTCALNWYFIRTGAQQPLSQGDDEPVEGDPPRRT